MEINGRFLTQRTTGVQRFAFELLNELNKHPDIVKEMNIKILVPKNFEDKEYPFVNIPLLKTNFLKGHLWEQFILPYVSRGKILINLCNTGPMFKRKQLTVIHDVAVYASSRNFSKSFRFWYKVMFYWMAKFTDKIVTVSHYSKDELMKYLKVPKERLGVMSEGKEQIVRIKADYSILERFQLNGECYLLAVSSLNPNKNFKSIIEAAKHLPKDIKVVIAGGSNNKIFKQDFDQTEVKAIFVGYVTDEQLKALYENAFCFIYSSYYEGFGLPPLEAMACGCPVILSDRTSLPEVGGDAVLYIDPEQPIQIVNHVNRILKNPSLREKMITNGYKQAEKFTWEKALEEFLGLIEEVRTTSRVR